MLSSRERSGVLLRYELVTNRYIVRLARHMIQAGLEDCKAELKADLELKLESEGKKGVVVGQWKEVLRSMPATVIRADPSCVVVKMENGEVKPAQRMICYTFGHSGGPADIGGGNHDDQRAKRLGHH